MRIWGEDLLDGEIVWLVLDLELKSQRNPFFRQSSQCALSLLEEKILISSTGIHTQNIIDGHGRLIVPRRVHSNGDFLSHHLIQHHTDLPHRRLTPGNRNDTSEGEEVHYQIDIGDETLHMELK